jgi:hypothetical protein
MCEQLSLLPLTHQFNRFGDLENTTYWELDENKDTPYYVIFNKETYCMLIHRDNLDWLENINEAEIVIITKGKYNGVDGYYEIMFISPYKPPYTVMVPGEFFTCETPLKENCWHGQFNIYAGALYYCVNSFNNVYYRTADTLPCCELVENMPEFTYEFCDDDSD